MNSTFKVVNNLVRDGVIQRYAIAGAVGALVYIEPTPTSDLDILISVDETTQSKSGLVTLEPIFAYLRNAGYNEFKDEGVVVEGWPIQFLPVANDLDAEGLEQAVDVEIPDDPSLKIRVLKPEHLVATALRVGRDKDYIRIGAFLRAKKVDFRALAAVLDRHNLWDAWRQFCLKTGTDNPAIIGLKT